MLWRMLSRLETCIVYCCIWSVTLAKSIVARKTWRSSGTLLHQNRKLSSRISLQNRLFCLCRLPAVFVRYLFNCLVGVPSTLTIDLGFASVNSQCLRDIKLAIPSFPVNKYIILYGIRCEFNFRNFENFWNFKILWKFWNFEL
jgi:hypothetical protein